MDCGNMLYSMNQGQVRFAHAQTKDASRIKIMARETRFEGSKRGSSSLETICCMAMQVGRTKKKNIIMPAAWTLRATA